MSIVMPAGFGIIGVNIKHEPARTRVFTTFGELRLSIRLTYQVWATL